MAAMRPESVTHALWIATLAAVWLLVPYPTGTLLFASLAIVLRGRQRKVPGTGGY